MNAGFGKGKKQNRENGTGERKRRTRMGMGTWNNDEIVFYTSLSCLLRGMFCHAHVKGQSKERGEGIVVIL